MPVVLAIAEAMRIFILAVIAIRLCSSFPPMPTQPSLTSRLMIDDTICDRLIARRGCTKSPITRQQQCGRVTLLLAFASIFTTTTAHHPCRC
jgi:hypothetical protein